MTALFGIAWKAIGKITASAKHIADIHIFLIKSFLSI